MNDEALYKKVFYDTDKVREYGERFWRSKIALQAFVKYCWRTCGKKKNLTPEQSTILEEAQHQIYTLRLQERNRKKREYLVREEKRRKKSLT